MNRGRPAPAWQQGRVDVDASELRRVQNRQRQDQAVRGDHSNVEVELRPVLSIRRIPKVDRGENRKSQLRGATVDGRWH